MKGWIVGSCLFLGVCCAIGKENPNIDPHAEHILRGALNFLAEAPHFGLTAEVWREHVSDSGQKLEFSRTVTMNIKRPNRLQVEIRAPFSDRCFFYNGKSLTVQDCTRNFYSTVDMPSSIDSMLNTAQDEFGIDLPLIDVALSDPYASATAKVQRGTYLTIAPVLGVPCHHLAFTQSNIDWQIWIEDGPQPVIRKFVITHKLEEGAPEFTALITKWDFANPIADSTFQFNPPPGATRIEMRKTENRESSLQESPPPADRKEKE